MKTVPVSRLIVTGGALSLMGLLIFIWMIQIQTSDSAKMIEDNSEGYTYVDKTFYPERGTISDRWGHLLAGNTEVYELGADLRDVSDPKNISMTLASIAGLDAGKTLELLTLPGDNTKPRYVVLSNSITGKQIEQIEALQKQIEQEIERTGKKRAEVPNLDGLLWTPHLERSYPEHSLASTILGFYSYKDRENGRGYFGVEGKYDHLLAGQPVELKVPQDPKLIDTPPDIPPGANLVLTIDRDIQAMTEQMVDQAVKETDSKSGTIVIMDPRNGEILSMASTPRLDPNEYWKYQEVFPESTPFNRAVGATYEPGSVFKVLTMAAALDNGTVKPDTPFLDTGSIVVGGIALHNWDSGAWGPQDMLGCMQHSLNVCLAWVATQMGPTPFYNYIQRFGIGHMTGVDLAGEVNFPLSVAGDPNWYPVNLGTNSYGQGVSTTPIQMITAVSAVANNEGKMMAPHVLKSVIEDGSQYENPPQVIGTPIKPETAKTLSEMLAVSLEKEASDALVYGYRVAGKTGTASIPGPDGYDSTLTNASFVGWGPVDDPRFIVYIWLEKPSTSEWGSVVAAPVFSEVVNKLVVLMDLPPDSVRQQLASGQAAANLPPADEENQAQ